MTLMYPAFQSLSLDADCSMENVFFLQITKLRRNRAIAMGMQGIFVSRIWGMEHADLSCRAKQSDVADRA